MLEQKIAALRHELEQKKWMRSRLALDLYDHGRHCPVDHHDSGERLRLRMDFPSPFYAGDFKLLRAAWIFKGKANLPHSRDLFAGERDVMQVTLTRS